MSDIELLQEAIKTLGDEATLQAIMTWVEAKKNLLSAEAGEEAAAADAEAAVAEAGEDATGTVAASAQPTETVELQEGVDSPAGMEPEAPQESGDAAAAQAAADVLSSAGEQIGMDLAGVIAAITERMDEFVAWLGGAQTDGTEATAEVAAQLSRAQATDLRKLADERKAEADAANARAADLEAQLLGRDIDDAIRCGKVLDTEGALLRELSKTNAPMVRERLGQLEDGEAVTQAKVIEASGKGNHVVSDTDTTSDEFIIYDNSLKGRIKDKAARHAEVRRLMATRADRVAQRRERRTN